MARSLLERHLARPLTRALEDTPVVLVIGPRQAGKTTLCEQIATTELTKQLSWSRVHAVPFHFRSYAGQEVDLVLEADDGRVVGIEVKAAGVVAERDFNGLRALRETAGRRFHRGVILYTGAETLPFGPSLWATPISALWAQNPEPQVTH
jgi:predicted AAA+ superfamily ATPase